MSASVPPNPSKYRFKSRILRSPTPHLFHSNISVSEEEYSRIRSALSRVQTEIIRLKEIEADEEGNEQIYRQRLACEEFIAKHKPLLHWTRRLPNELFVEVFIHCTDNNTRVPWNISQVCRKWRAIALATPQLWRLVILVCKPQFYQPKRASALLAFLSDYLLRSRRETIIFSWNPLWAAIFFDVLACHCERWGSVRLFLLNNGHLHLERQLIKLNSRLTSLYHLELVINKPLGFPLAVFKNTPELKYLCINCTGSSDDEIQLDWPWSQTTAYISYTFTYTSPLNVTALARFMNLTDISMVWNCGNNTEREVLRNPITFLACQRFSLEIRYAEWNANFAHLLSFMHFPLLKDLCIVHGSNEDIQALFAALAQFIERHSRDLKVLHWKWNDHVPSPGFQTDDFAAHKNMFSVLNNLEVLILTYPTYVTVGRLLASKMDTNCVHSEGMEQYQGWKSLFPKLKKLYFHFALAPFFGNISEQSKRDYYELVEASLGVFNAFVKFLELASMLDPDFQKLEVFEIQVDFPDSGGLFSKPLDLIFMLEDWENQLRQGWDIQVRLEPEIEKMEAWNAILEKVPKSLDADSLATVTIGQDVYATLDEIEQHDVEDSLSILATGLHETLNAFTTRVPDPSNPFAIIYHPLCQRASQILSEWGPYFLNSNYSRRWIPAGKDRIVYVPRGSSLRHDPIPWMFGIKHTEVEQ